MNMQNEDKEKTLGDIVSNAVGNTLRRIIVEKEVRSKMKNFIYFVDGDCFANNQLIDFPDKRARYFLLVRALVDNVQVDGSCSYKAIIDCWINEGVIVSKNPEAQKRSIDNALVQLYKNREEQRIKFPSRTLDGKKVIEKRKDRITFNNPITIG